MKRLLIGASLLAALSACETTTQRFYWGNYEQALYGYSRKPELRGNYVRALREAIDRGEQMGRVAPGLYAELGYLALEEGDRRGAAEAFEREMALFPESRGYLTKVMQRGSITPEPAEAAPDAADDQAETGDMS
jgi:hypothetical protein